MTGLAGPDGRTEPRHGQTDRHGCATPPPARSGRHLHQSDPRSLWGSCLAAQGVGPPSLALHWPEPPGLHMAFLWVIITALALSFLKKPWASGLDFPEFVTAIKAAGLDHPLGHSRAKAGGFDSPTPWLGSSRVGRTCSRVVTLVRATAMALCSNLLQETAWPGDSDLTVSQKGPGDPAGKCTPPLCQG